MRQLGEGHGPLRGTFPPSSVSLIAFRTPLPEMGRRCWFLGCGFYLPYRATKHHRPDFQKKVPMTHPRTAGSDAPARASAAPLDWEAVQADFLHSGMSLRRIANQHGINDRTLRKHRRAAGRRLWRHRWWRQPILRAAGLRLAVLRRAAALRRASGPARPCMLPSRRDSKAKNR